MCVAESLYVKERKDASVFPFTYKILAGTGEERDCRTSTP